MSNVTNHIKSVNGTFRNLASSAPESAPATGTGDTDAEKLIKDAAALEKDIEKLATAFASGDKTEIATALKEVAEALKTLLADASATGGDIATAVSGLKAEIDKLKDVLPATVMNTLDTILQDMSDGSEDLAQAISSFITTVESISPEIQAACQEIIKTLDNIVKTITDACSKIIDEIKKATEGITDPTEKKIVDDITNAIAEVAKAAAAVKTVVDSIATDIFDFFSGW